MIHINLAKPKFIMNSKKAKEYIKMQEDFYRELAKLRDKAYDEFLFDVFSKMGD